MFRMLPSRNPSCTARWSCADDGHSCDAPVLFPHALACVREGARRQVMSSAFKAPCGSRSLRTASSESSRAARLILFGLLALACAALRLGTLSANAAFIWSHSSRQVSSKPFLARADVTACVIASEAAPVRSSLPRLGVAMRARPAVSILGSAVAAFSHTCEALNKPATAGESWAQLPGCTSSREQVCALSSSLDPSPVSAPLLSLL
jgi:hypothetical protein